MTFCLLLLSVTVALSAIRTAGRRRDHHRDAVARTRPEVAARRGDPRPGADITARYWAAVLLALVVAATPAWLLLR